jgi:hypothetical protein
MSEVRGPKSSRTVTGDEKQIRAKGGKGGESRRTDPRRDTLLRIGYRQSQVTG